MDKNKKYVLCTKNLYFEDGFISFKKGQSYEIISEHYENYNCELTLNSETSGHHNVTTNFDNWFQHFIIRRIVLIEKTIK